jgi:GNAT superfamily N-acetyltransferase
MQPVPATIDHLDIVLRIVKSTIQTVYPAYYPSGAIEFFLDYHSDAATRAAIERGEVYLFEENSEFVATGSVEGNYLTRLFVLPEHQGKGYGSHIMDFLEDLAFQDHLEARLDASLPAVGMYLKRGYEISAYQRERTFQDHYLCYFDMKKRRPGEAT